MLCRKAEITQALESGNGVSGEIRVRAERRSGRTVIASAYRTAPFRLGEVGSRADSGEAEVIVQGVGPGYLPGDRIRVDISTERAANLTVRDQAALKLFPSSRGNSAESRIELSAKAGSRLVYLPGELIPYRSSIYKQHTRIDADPSAQVAYSEIITPGRVAMDECWTFTRLNLSIDVGIGGKPILRERNRIEPSLRQAEMLGRNGPFTCTGALYLIGAGWRAVGTGTTDDGARWASDGDGRYVLIRYLARTAQQIHQLIGSHIALASTAR